MRSPLHLFCDQIHCHVTHAADLVVLARTQYYRMTILFDLPILFIQCLCLLFTASRPRGDSTDSPFYSFSLYCNLMVFLNG